MKFHHVALSAGFAFSSALGLSACANQPAAEHAPAVDPSAACHADAAQHFVGKPVSQDTLNAAQKAASAAHVRHLKHDQPMTMDFRADRLNIIENNQGMIEQIRCG